MKNPRWFLFAILSLSWALSFGGCSPKRDPSVEGDRLEAAYRKIDQGRYDEAIADLDALKEGDTRPKVREALASAYAARAGLFIEKYWGFMVGFRAPLLSEDRLDETGALSQARKILSQLDGQIDQRPGEGLDKVAQLMAALQLWRDRIDALPTVTGDARKDIDRAVEVLRNQPAGSRLYRALLGLVTFKSDIVGGFDQWDKVQVHLRGLDLSNPKSSKNKIVLCRIDVGAFAKWAGGILGRLASTAEDITVAFPSKKAEIGDAVQKSRAFVFFLNGVKEVPCN